MKIIASLVILILVIQFSFILEVFIWGRGFEKDYYAILYLTFFASSILLVTKKRWALFLFLIITFCYTVLMTFNVSTLSIFTNNKVYAIECIVAFFALIVLVILVVKKLTMNNKNSKRIILIVSTILLALPVYSLSQHYNKNYESFISIKIECLNKDTLILRCKRQNEITNGFVVVSNSKELRSFIMHEGSLQNNSYNFVNITIVENFNFLKLQSITLQRINEKLLPISLSWKTSEIKGDKNSLLPK